MFIFAILTIWGVLLYLTFKLGLLVARNTLEVGLRKRRLNFLRFRFYVGCTVGLLIFGISFNQLIQSHFHTERFILFLAFALICVSEIYFWIRYLQLNSNFRKYSLKLFRIDHLTPYLSLSGSILILLYLLD